MEKETQDKSAQKDLPEEQSAQETEQVEKERIEAEKKYREHIEARLEECEYKEIDDRRYSFTFDGYYFVFRIPALMDKTKIKSILAQVAFSENGVYSATLEIERSGDLDLVCSTKLLTHMTVLLDRLNKVTDPENPVDSSEFIGNLTDPQEFDIGYNILVCEREFMDRKKKRSSNAQ